MAVSPPGPFYQRINHVLHREPEASMFYWLYWSILLTICMPVVIVLIYIQTGWRILTWYLGTSSLRPSYDPNNVEEYDMAVVINGCDSGFGKDLVISAAEAGYTVFAGCLKHDISKHHFDSLPKVISFQLDITKENDVSNAADMVSKWLSESEAPVKNQKSKRWLHAIVNNAGVGIFTHTDWTDVEVFQTVMDVNYFGAVRIVKSFLPILKQQAFSKKEYCGMRIINLVSMAGFASGLPGVNAYCASKHALQSYTDSLRIELHPFKIAVTSVNPSFHSTPMVVERKPKPFEELPPIVQTQYGQAFHENLLRTLHSLFTSTQWEPVVVVEQIMNSCLRSKFPPRQLLVGMDARFVTFPLHRLLPPQFHEIILATLFNKVKPACMIFNNQKSRNPSNQNRMKNHESENTSKED